MGSKAKYAKEILSIILKNRQKGQWYVEPFCGGCNVIDKVDGPRIASDNNPFVISLFSAVQSGWEPPDFLSEKEYYELKEKNKFSSKPPDPLTSFVCYGCSYSGKYWGGYARGKNEKGIERNYCLESKKNILAQKSGIQGIIFKCIPYDRLEIPKNSLIYCDPPYYNTTKYKDKFNHFRFWRWCDRKVKEGHTVFVSEYKAPKHWKCVWEKQVNSSLTKDTGSKIATERLFTI